MKRLSKALSVVFAVIMIVSTCTVGFSAYAATDDITGNYDFSITNTYETVDWDTWKPYKSATHVHTVRSDADTEVDDMIEYYYGFNFDAMALTDHGTVNYGWTSDQSRITIFEYQFFVHGPIDEISKERYTEITTGTGAVKGGSAPRGFHMTEIPLGIELNGMSTSKTHVNGFFVDAGHGELGITESWPRNAVKTNYDAKGISHINHVGEWSGGKSGKGTYNESFINDFVSIYKDYGAISESKDPSTTYGCVGMELVNTSDNRTRNDRYLFDEVMKKLAPLGINMYGFCEDDAHELSDCDRNAQFFLMPSNDKAANNIKTCMKTGAFYASSKNSKNPYELGDGFNATGDYPIPSYIGVDNEKNQIIVTAKNANKLRIVADGNIIDTITSDLGENTTIFDLNKYEDKINSYVRIYLTGPGGITYLQNFLLKKEYKPIASVTFEVPSSDTDVKVYNSLGSLVESSGVPYKYNLDAGNYTYVASRPGYITTEEIPFTVTQSDIDNAVQKKISVTLEENSNLIYTYFYVPETIYIDGSDMRTFSSYVDRQYGVNGALNSSPSYEGNIYFERPGASDISLTYETVDGVSVNSMNVTNTTSSSNTLSSKITSGIMSYAMNSNGSSVIKWTATYHCDGRTLTSYAYTYIYAPLSGGSSCLAAGGFAETKKNFPGWSHSTMSVTATLWVSGIQSITGGYAGYKFAPNGGSTFAESSGIAGIVTVGSGMGTSEDSSSGGSKTVNPRGGVGTLSIDTSRYNNYGQIPGFKIGLDVNDSTQCTMSRGEHTQYVDFGSTRLFSLSNIILNDYSGKRIYESSPSTFNVPIDTGLTSIDIRGHVIGYKESRTDEVNGTVTVEFNYVDKAPLRAQIENAIKNAYQPDWFVDQNEYDAYINSIQAASVVLGNPTATVAQIEAASTNLKNALNSVELVKGTATVNHCKASGEIIETETFEYTMCDTIVASAKELDGYTYADNWENVVNDEVIKSGTESFGSLMALKNNYVFNFYYDANKYDVTFSCADSSFVCDAPYYSAEYNSSYVLPTNVPSLTGYTFAGWILDLNGETYQSGESIVWDYAQNGNFTAAWNANEYTVIYNTNGGEQLAQPAVQATYGDIFNVSGEIPTKSGYTFTGWLCKFNGQNIGILSPNSQFTWEYNGNVTLTAQWEIIDLTITFNANGGTVSTETKTVIHGSTYGELPIPVKTGYNFDGWYLDQQFKTPISAANTVKIVADQQVFAKWSKGSYVITYMVDGVFHTSSTYNYGDTVIPASVPFKNGYTFSGWTGVPSTMPAENITVIGSFKVNSYTITYKVDGEVYKNVSYNYGAQVKAETAPTKVGYAFSGWTGVPSTMPANNVTVTGNFTLVDYNLTYYLDGNIYNSSTHHYGDSITALPEPKKTGYTFSGWKGVPSTMPANNVNVNGSFTPNTYNVNYYVDGVLYTTESYLYQESITVIAEPSKTGYTFSGWSSVPSKMPARDVTVNGSYTVNRYVYMFILDGEYRSDLTITANYGEQITTPVPSLERNYAFSGWSPSVPTTMGAEDKTFTGTTYKAKSDISFNLNSGSGNAIPTSNYVIGEVIDLPRTGYTKAGYTFGGWAESANAENGSFTYTVTENDVTLYAVWQAIPVSIEPAHNSSTIVDKLLSLIYGIKERLTITEFENSYVDIVGENAEVEYECGLGFGTGTKVNLKNNGTVEKTYTLVVYGDVDGDGIADGQDVMLVTMLKEGILTKNSVSEAVYEAADCDHDGNITENDVSLITQSGIMSYTIDQSK